MSKSNDYAARAIREAQKRIKKDPVLRRQAVIKLPKFWWLPAFLREKVLIQKELEETKQVLTNYAEHTALQSQALKDLYAWALAHDDGTMEELKKRLGPLNPSQGGMVYDASQAK